MDSKTKIDVVHKYVEAFDKLDMNMIREMYTPDARVEDPVGTDPYVGIEAIAKFYEGGFSAGAKLVLTGEPRCAGNAVAFPFQVKMPGLVIDVIDVFELNADGKVCSMKAYWSGENMRSE